MIGADAVRILTGRSKHDIGTIVGRHHVSERPVDVATAVMQRARPMPTGPLLRAAIVYAMIVHERNRRNYNALQKGDLAAWR